MSTTNRERRLSHTYKAQQVHTHNVASVRIPGEWASVRCARPACRKPREAIR